MNRNELDEPMGCGGKCSRCPLGEDERPTGGLQGWRLVVRAGGAFLVPLVAALVGAVIAGEGGTNQVIGALSGLAIGIGTVLAISRFTHPRDEECA